MGRANRFAWLAAGAILAAGGCSRPTLVIRHRMPTDMPLPPSAHVVRVEPVAVEAGPDGAFADYAAKAVTDRLGRSEQYALADAADQADLSVRGRLWIEQSDSEGTRPVRLWSGDQAETMKTVTVPTLVRSVTLRADFELAGADGKPLGAAETHQAYLSSDDPRVRGELGLGRPDDPAKVPPVETIVRELIDVAADTFAAMIVPTEAVAEVRMRPTLNSNAAEGAKAAERGDYATAVRHLEAAAKYHPEDANVLFNLAVAEEAAGRLDDALGHYRGVLKLNAKAADAAEAVGRLERVIARQSR